MVSHQAAKRVYAELAHIVRTTDPRAAADRLGLVQVSDQGALAGWVDEVLAAHPGEVARFRGGETKLMAFFVGQVMKRSKGKADPKGVQPVFQQRLASRPSLRSGGRSLGLASPVTPFSSREQTHRIHRDRPVAAPPSVDGGR